MNEHRLASLPGATDGDVTRPAARGGDDGAGLRDVAGLEVWQYRLLPFMVWMVGGVTVFFLIVTLFQLNALQQRIDDVPELDLGPALASLDGPVSSSADRLVFAQWKTLASLERQALERRYHQANVLLVSRTWVRYLGFMTGMILALVGAAFILGKLREEVSTLGLEQPGVKATLTTTSPGLVLGVLGTCLMLAALLSHNDIVTEDAPLYTRVQVSAEGGSSAPMPLPLDAVVDPLSDEATDGGTAAEPLSDPAPGGEP